MSTLDQVLHGLQHGWDSLAEGWHALRQRAGHALTRFTPISTTGAAQTPADQLLHNAAHWGLLTSEVRETTDRVVVKLEAPGMEPQDFEIEVVDDVLVVRGHKHIENEAVEGRYYLLERAYGSFERAFRLPAAVQRDQTSAQYHRGVLTIALPKSHPKTSRRIAISTE